MLRRLVLVGLLVLVRGMIQLILGTLFAAIFLLFQVQASPYADMGDDFLASACSFGLVALLYVPSHRQRTWHARHCAKCRA